MFLHKNIHCGYSKEAPYEVIGHVECGKFTKPHFSWTGFKSSLWLTSTCEHSFARNWQMPFLTQRKGMNDHRKYLMNNLHEREKKEKYQSFSDQKSTLCWTMCSDPFLSIQYHVTKVTISHYGIYAGWSKPLNNTCIYALKTHFHSVWLRGYSSEIIPLLLMLSIYMLRKKNSEDNFEIYFSYFSQKKIRIGHFMQTVGWNFLPAC